MVRLIKSVISEGIKRIKSPKIKKGISVFLKILAGLAFLRSILSIFNIDLGSDDELDSDFEEDTGIGAYGSVESDFDGDGVVDSIAIDTDGDGIIDVIQYDSDGDGFMDEELLDIDGDGQFGSLDSELERDFLKKQMGK